MKASFPAAADDSRQSAAVTSAVEVISITSGPKNDIRTLGKKYRTNGARMLNSMLCEAVNVAVPEKIEHEGGILGF